MCCSQRPAFCSLEKDKVLPFLSMFYLSESPCLKTLFKKPALCNVAKDDGGNTPSQVFTPRWETTSQHNMQKVQQSVTFSRKLQPRSYSWKLKLATLAGSVFQCDVYECKFHTLL